MYSPGDHLAIYPENDSALVEAILKRLNPTPGPDEPIIVEHCTDTGNCDFTSFIAHVNSCYYSIQLFINCYRSERVGAKHETANAFDST